MHHKENASRKLFYLLILTCIPVFFILALSGLYFIELEEWVNGQGKVIPVNTNNLFIKEDAVLQKIHCQQGDIIKKGQVIATFMPRIHDESAPFEIQASHDGIIISSLLKETGNFFKKDTTLVTIASNKIRNISITISEKDFSKLSKDFKVRYEPNTVSINANDYYWGKLNRINPIATAMKDENNNAQFTAEGSIEHYGNEVISQDSLHNIPFGSTGKISIAIGKRSLLLQLIGWN